MKSDSRVGYAVVGGIIIVVGLYLLLGVITQLPIAGIVLQYWPLTIVLLGLAIVFASRDQAVVGAILALSGLIIIADKLGWLGGAVGRTVQGILLLLIGLVVLAAFAKPRSDR